MRTCDVTNPLVWERRAAQARHFAERLAPADSRILHRYAAECEARAVCLDRDAGERPCDACPLAREHACQGRRS